MSWLGVPGVKTALVCAAALVAVLLWVLLAARMVGRFAGIAVCVILVTEIVLALWTAADHVRGRTG